MVYGWRHCQYLNVQENLEYRVDAEEDFPIKKMYSNTMGCLPSADHLADAAITLEGRKLNRIAYKKKRAFHKVVARQCKTALTNLVLENYKRIEEGRAIIPLLFCIDIDGNPRPWSIDKIVAKEQRYNDQITHKELRRAYKLYMHENSKVRAAAAATLKFVKLTYLGNATYALQETASPWADAETFSTFWAARKACSRSSPKKDIINWRKQLAGDITVYERTKAKATAPSYSLGGADLDAKKENMVPSPEVTLTTSEEE